MFIFSLAAARGWLHWDSRSPSPIHITQHCCPHINCPSPPLHLQKSDKIKDNWPDQHWLVFSHIRVYEKEPSCVANEHNTPPPHPAPHPPSPFPSPSSTASTSGGAAVYHVALWSLYTARDSTWLQAQLALNHAQISSVLPISPATQNILP